MLESRINNLWDFILTRNKLNNDNRPSVIENFNKLITAIDEYDQNFDKILDCIKGSSRHKELLKIEAKLYQQTVKLKKLLNIYIYDPDPNGIGRNFMNRIPKTRDAFPVIN
jgi:hypothetical protein